MGRDLQKSRNWEVLQSVAVEVPGSEYAQNLGLGKKLWDFTGAELAKFAL